jgi:CAI-1 autoinducer synthase
MHDSTSGAGYASQFRAGCQDAQPARKTADPHDARQKVRNLPDFVSERVARYYERAAGWRGGHILHGLTPGAGAVKVSSNDYLDLACHPAIMRAQTACLESSGGGMLMSAVFLHEGSPQGRLERRLANIMGAEDGIVAQSGYAANVGLLQSLARKDLPVYIDMMAHMSLWDGIQTAGADARPFMHNDANHLRRQIQRYGTGIVVVDSVYSTNGSLCELEAIVGAGSDYNCVVVVDESHSLGTHGAMGEGLVAALQLNDQVHFVTASLAKAFAGRGGFITCSKRFKEYFLLESHPAIFSSSLLPHEIAGFETTLDIILDAAPARARLHEITARLRSGLAALGYCLDGSEQILALEAGTEDQVIVLRDALQRRGVFGSVFMPPATAKNRALVRMSLNSGLTDPQVAHILAVCAEIRDEVGLAQWSSTKRHQKLAGRAASVTRTRNAEPVATVPLGAVSMAEQVPV